MVSMAQFKVMRHPAILSSIGLGSCIGLVLYDPITKIGGLAHIMLPSMQSAKDKSKPGKFADSALRLVVKEMEGMGAHVRHLRAKVFGGANMFSSIADDSCINIGERNLEAVREELGKKKIRIVAEEVGGKFGRTIFFDLKDGTVRVRDVKGEERIY